MRSRRQNKIRRLGSSDKLGAVRGPYLGLLAVWALLPDLWYRWQSREVLRKRKVGNKVALTFDDGPDPVYTPRILDILARWSVSATFFMVAENAAGIRSW